MPRPPGATRKGSIAAPSRRSAEGKRRQAVTSARCNRRERRTVVQDRADYRRPVSFLCISRRKQKQKGQFVPVGQKRAARSKVEAKLAKIQTWYATITARPPWQSTGKGCIDRRKNDDQIQVGDNVPLNAAAIDAEPTKRLQAIPQTSEGFE